MSRKSKLAHIEQRRQKVAANLLAGLTYRQMADALGVSIGTIANDVKIIIGRWQRETVKVVDEHVALELRRIDRALHAIWSDVLEGKLTYIDRMVKLMDRKAKYLGLDAPEKVAPTDPSGEKEYGSDGLTDDQRLEKLLALLDKARARRGTAAHRSADGD